MTRPNMNGLRTEYCEHKAKRKTGKEYVWSKTVFVALPPECWRPIQGGCGCDYCKAHPDLIPHWDTLTVDATGKRSHTGICHYPEFTNPTAQPWSSVS